MTNDVLTTVTQRSPCQHYLIYLIDCDLRWGHRVVLDVVLYPQEVENQQYDVTDVHRMVLPNDNRTHHQGLFHDQFQKTANDHTLRIVHHILVILV